MSEPLRRRWVRRLLIGAAALGALAVIVGQGLSDGANDAEDLLGFPSRGGAESFRLVYRVETGAGSESRTTWEERLVRRPFEGRLLGFAERPDPGSRGGSGTMTTAEGVFLVGESGETNETAGRVHGPPIGDFGFLSVLDDLVDDGIVVDQGTTREVVDRRCRIYRTFEPPSISLAAPTKTSYDELCIDSDGLVLGERWVIDGEVLLVREAVELDAAPPDELLQVFEEAAADGESPPEPAELRGPHEGFLEPPPRPRGFSEVGRFEFAPDVRGGTTAGGVYRSVYWVYTRGTDYLVVEGGTGATPFSLEGGRALNVPGLGSGRLVVGEQGAEARLTVGSATWLRVRASAPRAWIERYLGTLSVGT